MNTVDAGYLLDVVEFGGWPHPELVALYLICRGLVDAFRWDEAEQAVITYQRTGGGAWQRAALVWPNGHVNPRPLTHDVDLDVDDLRYVDLWIFLPRARGATLTGSSHALPAGAHILTRHQAHRRLHDLLTPGREPPGAVPRCLAHVAQWLPQAEVPELVCVYAGDLGVGCGFSREGHVVA